MGIVVLTYDHPHRKTEDVLWRLLSAGYSDITVLATPWQVRKPRKFLYAHRPAEDGWPCEPQAFDAPKNLVLPKEAVDNEKLVERLNELDPEIVIVGGAGILPAKVVNNFNVLNVHPGLLPARRGLDVLKWSIIDCKQVGVTAHLCDERTDLGWLILERTVPVRRNDTFHSFAMRQYEYEIALIPEAIEKVESMDGKGGLPEIPQAETRAYRRMPLKIEADLLEAFERYKRVFAV